MGGPLKTITNLVSDVVKVSTLGLVDLAPDAPDVPAAPTTEVETGAIAGEGGGKTFDEGEEESRRKAVRKKRLGTKQLQIPLEKTTTGIATTTSTGIKV